MNESKRRALLPYGTDFSAPKIDLPDIDLWQTQRGSLARSYFQNRIYKLQEQYKELVELSKLNEDVYASEYNLEPKVGQTYHLYRNFSGKTVLSLIDPPWSTMEYIGPVLYTADSVWKPLDIIKDL